MADISHGCINKFCDECGGSESCQIFKQRQEDLSDDNKVDVIDALLNNTWGTTQTFYLGDQLIDKSETSINLEQFLIEAGIDPNNLPDYIGSDIFSPTKFTDLREISALIPEGSGADLLALQEQIEKIKNAGEDQWQTSGGYPQIQWEQYPDRNFGVPAVCSVQYPCGSIRPNDVDIEEFINEQHGISDSDKVKMIAVFGLVLMMAGGGL